MLLILLMTGMETDLKLVKDSSRASISASIFGIIVPFSCGFALGELLPDAMIPDPNKRLITSLFLGTALSIASVKIVATVVREMNFLRRTVGQVILGSAIVDDTIGWIIIAVIFGLALQGHVDPLSVAKSVIGTLAFMAFQPDHRPTPRVAGDPLGQRHLRQRVRRDHRDPGDHGADGADHAT